MNDETDVVFRDAIMLALAGFISIIILLLPFINPPQKNQEKDDQAPGNVLVEIRWQDGVNVDVDLWVLAPGDKPVGYSAKSGIYFNLLRDDLGNISDSTSLNYETAYSRGAPLGEYVVNVHLFRTGNDTLPLEVEVNISVKKSPDVSALSILYTKVKLHNENQELTVFRFKLDKDGNLLRESVHDLPYPLRSKAP